MELKTYQAHIEPESSAGRDTAAATVKLRRASLSMCLSILPFMLKKMFTLDQNLEGALRHNGGRLPIFRMQMACFQ